MDRELLLRKLPFYGKYYAIFYNSNPYVVNQRNLYKSTTFAPGSQSHLSHLIGMCDGSYKNMNYVDKLVDT